MIQRMFVTLDTKKTNYKNVGKINHGDDLILELTVLSDGGMIRFDDPMVDLLVKKSDGKMIRQNSGIEHIKPNKFIIEVKKDCVTSPGLSTNQLIINDNGRISTCMFYYTILNSLEEDIIESISNVEVLEQLDEFTIQMKDKMENFDEELQNRMSELEDAIDDLVESFGDTSVELLEAELSRNEAEQLRAQAESIRVQNESRRLQNDLDLANAEAERVRAENVRIQNEVDRALIDAVMDQKESKREDSELERIQNESKRTTDELVRQQNENTRQSNETIRTSNETDRKTQENRRVTAETNRVNAETTRRNNENSRISNEIERQKAMNEMKRLIDEIDLINLKEKYGIIGDGSSHKLNSKYSSLEEARAKYRYCTSLEDEVDWCAIQHFILDNGYINLPNGTYITNNPIFLRSGDKIISNGARIIKINNDKRLPSRFNEKSEILGFPNKFDSFNVNAVVVLYHNNNEATMSCSIQGVILQGTQNVSPINDLTNYATYGIYAPMSSHCNYSDIGIRGCEYAYYTNDSYVTRFSKAYITYCKNGLSHIVKDDLKEHYWTGTSLGVDNMCFSCVNLPIDVNHIGYSTFSTITIDNNILRTNGIKTKAIRIINSILTINSLGVEGSQMRDGEHFIHVASTNDSYGNLTGLVTINNLDFEAHVYGGNNSNVICCDNATLILNEPHIVYGDNTNSTTVIKAINNAIIKFNNPSRNFSDLRDKRTFIDGTSKVYPLCENKIVYGTQPPTGDNWKSGDICINTSIGNGNYEKFICSGGSSWFGVNQIGYVKLSEHPTSNIYRGYKYWNTTKNKMLVFDGSIWVDYDGNHVP